VDFELDEDQQELRNLAADLLDREATAGRLTEHERGNAAYDAATWKALAQAGLLGACLPPESGGSGLGAVGLAVVLREIGAHVAPVPAYAALALGAMTIARHGTPAQRELLTLLAEGDVVLTGAPREPGAGVRTTARRAGDAYILDGVKTFVPYAAEASHILVPARVVSSPQKGAHPQPSEQEIGVFLVERTAVDLSPHPSTTGEPMSRLGLDGVRVDADALLGDGAWPTLGRYAMAGAVATVCGVIDGALKLTTEYVKTREQFGRALAGFQAVTMQIGDVYIAKRALDVTMWAGVWRLAEDDPDVDEVLAIASYNACDPVVRALYACQHLHGGVGIDVTYPLHRYFAWGKHYGHLLGGPEAQLDTIGALACSSI
jgi:alkylation response protein AidB-like acyl-CoA dehydrogenase